MKGGRSYPASHSSHMRAMTNTFLPLLRALVFMGVAQFLIVGAGQAQSSSLPAPGMLPDHPLYFLKSSSEAIGTLFTFGELADGERSLDLAEKRRGERTGGIGPRARGVERQGDTGPRGSDQRASGARSAGSTGNGKAPGNGSAVNPRTRPGEDGPPRSGEVTSG